MDASGDGIMDQAELNAYYEFKAMVELSRGANSLCDSTLCPALTLSPSRIRCLRVLLLAFRVQKEQELAAQKAKMDAERAKIAAFNASDYETVPGFVDRRKSCVEDTHPNTRDRNRSICNRGRERSIQTSFHPTFTYQHGMNAACTNRHHSAPLNKSYPQPRRPSFSLSCVQPHGRTQRAQLCGAAYRR